MERGELALIHFNNPSRGEEKISADIQFEVLMRKTDWCWAWLDWTASIIGPQRHWSLLGVRLTVRPPHWSAGPPAWRLSLAASVLSVVTFLEGRQGGHLVTWSVEWLPTSCLMSDAIKIDI